MRVDSTAPSIYKTAMHEPSKPNLKIAQDVEAEAILARQTEHETSFSKEQVSIGTYEKLAVVKNDSPNLVVLPPLMSETEARQCLNDIKRHWNSIRALVLELKERRGWEALKYPNLTACLEAEFLESRTKLVRELKAAEVEKYVLQVPIGTLPASHFRPLSKLKPEQYKLALDKAYELAGNDRLTAVHVTKAVKAIVESSRLLKQPEPSKFQPGELVQIKCRAGALPRQKMWNGCWGIVQSTGVCVSVLVGDRKVDYGDGDLERDDNCNVQFRETCKRILVLWQTKLEPIEQTILKELQRRHVFTELEMQLVACIETKNSGVSCEN